MKFSFANPDGISMVAETPEDMRDLARLVENRATVSFVVGGWQRRGHAERLTGLPDPSVRDVIRVEFVTHEAKGKPQ